MSTARYEDDSLSVEITMKGEPQNHSTVWEVGMVVWRVLVGLGFAPEVASRVIDHETVEGEWEASTRGVDG